MAIKVWDYLEEYEVEKVDIFEGIEKVFGSGKLILGNSVENFEKEFSHYCHCKYGIGVDNATHGIFLSIKALGIGNKDEVITVSNTAVPTVAAIVGAGATPKFVDIETDTYLMNINKVEAAITKNTKCILPVHLYGQCVDMTPILEIAKKNELFVIEDCAQCHGAEYKNKKAGSLSDMGVFSFYPTKPLGGYGDGGMIVTNNKKLEKKLRRLRFYGMEDKYYSEEHGYNARLDEIHAEILSRKLKRIGVYINKRNTLAKRYYHILKDTSLILPKTRKNNSHVYYIYACRHKNRDYIIEELKKFDIHVNISYPWPIHTMRGYKYLGYKEGDLPLTEGAAREIFSLPMYPMFKHKDQDKVCKALSEILGEKINL
ncbi:Aminotransferase, DegT/DnrJ/EryC1/StrS family [Olavius algarvensis associated proteobacterium Delta 3]|nr:Aminotransferase, DegT/DnrJ/EryC1/StrS family [Olavius algarvensis associated proteobacterium Delta 3]CAB5101299.1 Aminotransferase, DegT/DnrJ/EryC1/StrS family [Olavius algarvensis associated proteobacterium Delta 3]